MKINSDNYVDEAERVILELKKKTDKKGKEIPLVTTSKLRNLLAMTADIYNEVLGYRDEKLSTALRERIEYLRVRFLYEAGREPGVKALVEAADITSVLKDAVKSKSNYILFNRYMEALVAFHKYHGGKDN